MEGANRRSSRASQKVNPSSATAQEPVTSNGTTDNSIEIKDNFQCGSCRHVFPTKEKLKEHFTEHFVGEKYVCESCGEHFKIFNLFHDHCIQHIINLYCLQCRRSFENVEEFERHQEIHLWDCDLCYEKFNKEQLFLIHMHAEHGIESIKCEICHKYFSSKDQISQHYLKYHQNKTECSVCSKTLATQNSLRRHMKRHFQDKSFFCSTCGQEFNDHMQLKYHEMKHSGNYAFECPICSKGYPLKRTLKLHMQSHLLENTDLPFGCTLCEKRFNAQGKLIIHMKSHSNERPYKCDICPKGFNFSSHLKRHKESHVKGTLEVYRPSCPECSETFKSRKALEAHTKIHHAPKNFECVHCSLHFEHLREFARHMLSHSEGLTFTCNMCEKSFAKKTKAVVHFENHFPDFFPRSCSKCSALVESRKELDVHSCQSPFTCKVCNKDLKNRTRMLLHMTKHSAKPALHCPLCHKLFRLKHHLKRHTKLHLKKPQSQIENQSVGFVPTLSKPHGCELCGKVFQYPSQLEKHFLAHTREREERTIVKNIVNMKKMVDLELSNDVKAS